MKKAKKLGSAMGSKRSLKSLSTISLAHEPALEKWARLFRFQKALPIIEEKLKNQKEVRLIDFGCGQDILLYKFITESVPSAKERLIYSGIDPLLPKERLKLPANVSLYRRRFEEIGEVEKADVITCLAVLEHVDDPQLLVTSALKRLKKNGVLVITTPTPKSKPILEFLSRILGLISRREIDEHKQYPDKAYLLRIMKKIPNRESFQGRHEYFEMGLNNLLIVKRV